MACDLNAHRCLDLLGRWGEDGSGRLLPGEVKVPLYEPVENNVKVPVQVGGEEVNVVTCSH